MYYSESGDEWKKFNTRDGMGIKLLQRAGIVTAIITQESTKMVMRRAQKLTIPEVHQGAFDKLAVLKDLIARQISRWSKLPTSGTMSTICRPLAQSDFQPLRPMGWRLY